MSAYNYVGADGSSYPEIASRAVRGAAQQSPSPVYGYLRSGQQQKIYLFGAIDDAHGWLTSIVHSQAQPYDYAAVFAATDLSQPVAGLESFGHAYVSGDPQVGSFWPFLAGLPLGLLGGYAYRGWQAKHPGQWIPGIAGDPSVGGPWVDVVGAMEDETRRRAWPQTHALIQSAIHEALASDTGVRQNAAAMGQPPVANFVWKLVAGPEEVGGPPIYSNMNFFRSREEALDYARRLSQIPNVVASAVFDTTSAHWPNPVAWHKSDGPMVNATIAQYLAHSAPGTHVVGGPWVDMVGGPWVDMVGPQVGTWVDITGDGTYTIGGPWVDVVGAQTSPHVDERVLRHHQWPQTKALIQSAIDETSQAATQGPAEAYVWSLDPPGPSTMPGVVLEGTTFVTPFGSHAEALDYMRARIQTPHVALALFDRRSPHWPNPVNWTKSNDPTYEPIIAAQAAKAPGPRMAGWPGGRDARVGSALADVRSRAQSIANKRAGQVVGVIYTPRDNLWHAFAFGSQDDADDWLDTATRDQDSYTYAAYYDKADATWPRAVIEKIGGTRPRALTSGAVVGAPIDDYRSHAQALAGARAGRAVGTLRSTDGVWHSLGFHSLDDAVDWLQSATRDRARFVYAAIFEKGADGSAFFQGEEVGPSLSRRGITTTSGDRGRYTALAA